MVAQIFAALMPLPVQPVAGHPDGRLAYVNEAMASMHGYTVEELLAMSPEQLLALVHPRGSRC